jgi:hypothetical protein
MAFLLSVENPSTERKKGVSLEVKLGEKSRSGLRVSTLLLISLPM